MISYSNNNKILFEKLQNNLNIMYNHIYHSLINNVSFSTYVNSKLNSRSEDYNKKSLMYIINASTKANKHHNSKFKHLNPLFIDESITKKLVNTYLNLSDCISETLDYSKDNYISKSVVQNNFLNLISSYINDSQIDYIHNDKLYSFNTSNILSIYGSKLIRTFNIFDSKLYSDSLNIRTDIFNSNNSIANRSILKSLSNPSFKNISPLNISTTITQLFLSSIDKYKSYKNYSVTFRTFAKNYIDRNLNSNLNSNSILKAPFNKDIKNFTNTNFSKILSYSDFNEDNYSQISLNVKLPFISKLDSDIYLTDNFEFIDLIPSQTLPSCLFKYENIDNIRTYFLNDKRLSVVDKLVLSLYFDLELTDNNINYLNNHVVTSSDRKYLTLFKNNFDYTNFNNSITDLSRLFSVSTQHINQIKLSALAKLKKNDDLLNIYNIYLH